ACCLVVRSVSLCGFFFQAEDGIRDRNVTGVQTCALPIWPVPAGRGIGTEVDFPTPAPDFALSRIDLEPGAEPVSYRPVGPEVLLCTSGTVRVGQDSTSETLGPGRAAWLPASTPVVTLESSDGAAVFRTRVGDGESAARRP